MLNRAARLVLSGVLANRQRSAADAADDPVEGSRPASFSPERMHKPHGQSGTDAQTACLSTDLPVVFPRCLVLLPEFLLLLGDPLVLGFEGGHDFLLDFAEGHRPVRNGCTNRIVAGRCGWERYRAGVLISCQLPVRNGCTKRIVSCPFEAAASGDSGSFCGTEPISVVRSEGGAGGWPGSKSFCRVERRRMTDIASRI